MNYDIIYAVKAGERTCVACGGTTKFHNGSWTPAEAEAWRRREFRLTPWYFHDKCKTKEPRF